MPMTHAEHITSIAGLLSDGSRATWTTTGGAGSTDELLVPINDALTTVSSRIANMVRHNLLTDGTTRRITLSAADKWKLVWGDFKKYWCEYEVGEEPEERKNCDRMGDTIYLDSSALPAASASVYIWLGHKHLLQSAIGTTDTAGAVKTAAALLATSLILKSLGTGTINEDTKLTIAGDSTVYHVTATVTIATNEATVSIFPPLVVAADVDDVVTLALADSTLTPQLEKIVDYLAAGTAAMSKSRKYITNNTMLSGAKWQDWMEWGKNMYAIGMAELDKLVVPQASETYED